MRGHTLRRIFQYKIRFCFYGHMQTVFHIKTKFYGFFIVRKHSNHLYRTDTASKNCRENKTPRKSTILQMSTIFHVFKIYRFNTKIWVAKAIWFRYILDFGSIRVDFLQWSLKAHWRANSIQVSVLISTQMSYLDWYRLNQIKPTTTKMPRERKTMQEHLPWKAASRPNSGSEHCTAITNSTAANPQFNHILFVWFHMIFFLLFFWIIYLSSFN